MAVFKLHTNYPSLGGGGYGDVFPCTHTEDDGTVLNDQLAVKICRVEDGEDEAEKYKRFRNGGQLCKRLRHANIMPVIQVGNRAQNGVPYIIMPLANGGNLDRWLEEQPRTTDEMAGVFKQVLEAIAFAHTQQVLHRDVKSENVLFNDGVPLVADFDLAKDLDPDTAATGITQTNVGIGTKGYVAPEQWSDMKRVGPPADVYALGRLWWRMLTGKFPPHLVPLNLGAVPAEYRAFIEKATEFRAEDRYGTATEMLRAFESLLTAPPGSPKQVAQDLAAEWNDDEPEKHYRTLRKINEHFRLHPDDVELHYELAPFLPPTLLDAWMAEHAGGFAQMVEAVDDVSSGNLLWDDCDGFARFYLRVFAKSADPTLRSHAIERVLCIGASHNRYPVANMLRYSLEQVKDDDTAAVVVRAVEAQNNAASWFKIPASYHPHIVAAFEAAEEDDGIPF